MTLQMPFGREDLIVKEAKAGKQPARLAGKRGIQSISVGVSILRALASAPGPMALRDLAKAAGMLPSKAYRYLVSFGVSGMIKQDEQTSHYDIGPLASELGLAALGRIDAAEIVTSELTRLAIELRHDAHTTVWTPHGPMVLRWKQGSNDIAIRIGEGAILPLLTTATGRIWACYLPSSMTHALVEFELDQLHKTTNQPKATLRDKYEERLEQVRRLGFSHVEGERRSGIDALSSPIFGPGGLAFAMTLLGSHGDADFSYDGPSARRLIAATKAVSRQLGGSLKPIPH
jgi:DNA-binding IclR family transcriptional regulator